VGRCKSFDASADGYGRGEGFALAVMGKLNPDQPSVAVVRSTAVNQDGQSSGLTAPNGPAQTKLVMNAMQLGGLEAGEGPRFVAVHGTGTPLGDPIEVGALAQVLRGSRSGQAADPMVLGSVKSCYGHTEGTAGITGLLMAVGAANHQGVPPVMHLRTLNPYVEAALGDWARAAGKAAHSSTALLPRQLFGMAQQAQHLTAGTSSFGMSGVNAHALISAGNLLAASSHRQEMEGVLQRQRYWPLPTLSSLLHCMVGAAGSDVRFACSLNRASLAFCWQHAVMETFSAPAAVLLEIMSAAGDMLAVAATHTMALCAATISSTILMHSDAVQLECSVDFRRGILKIHDSAGSVCCEGASGALAATPALQAPTTPLSPVHRTLSLMRVSWDQNSRPNAVAAVVDASMLQPHGYHMHPAVSQAALVLSAVKPPSETVAAEVMLGCEAYVPGTIGLASLAVGGNSIIASSSREQDLLSLASQTALPATKLQGLVTRPVFEDLRQRLTSSEASAAWQLQWKPVRFSAATSSKEACCLLLSTTPCSMAQICGYAAKGSRHAITAVHATIVTGGCTPTRATSAAAAGVEFCVSTEAHLELLLGALDVQHCLYAHHPQPLSNEDVSVGLMAYRTVARCEKQLTMSLLTFDSQEVAPHPFLPQPAAQMMQGERVCVYVCREKGRMQACMLLVYRRRDCLRLPPLNPRSYCAARCAGIARTLFMEARGKYGPSIDLSGIGRMPAAQLSAILRTPGEYVVAVRGGTAYSLRLALAEEAPRARAAPVIRSALITGGTKVG
jgi:hypothetical protein